MTRRAYVNLEGRWLFFWSPKSGNSALADWLINALGPRAQDARRRLPKMASRDFMRITNGFADHLLAADLVRDLGFEHFVLARDPYRRAVSAYFEKFVHRYEPLDSFDKLRTYSRNLYATARGNGAAYEGLSFVAYLTTIAEAVERLSPSGEPAVNDHFSTQVPFHFETIGFRYRNIVRLESVASDIVPIAKRLGIDAPFPRARERQVAVVDGDEDLSRVSSLELARSGVYPGEANLLNDATRQLIRRAYGIDFRMLGYDERGGAEASPVSVEVSADADATRQAATRRATS